jgi:Uncharacterized conserved protein
MSDYLLRIVVNEQSREERKSICKKILSYLWGQGTQGATMLRGEAGLDDKGGMSYDILEDPYYNNLPIIIESVIDHSILNHVEEGLKAMVKQGQISVTKGLEEDELKNHEYFTVKIYTRENKKFFNKEDYEKVLSFLHKKNVIWATVTKGIAGYGQDRVIHNQHIFSMSDHLPIVVECLIEKEHLTELLEELKQIVTEGIVFTAPADVIVNQ